MPPRTQGDKKRAAAAAAADAQPNSPTAPAPVAEAQKKEKDKWGPSVNLWQDLYRFIITDKIPKEMSPEEVLEASPQFKTLKRRDLWTERLNSVRAIVARDKKRTFEENERVACHLQQHPPKQTDAYGRPRWQNSRAQAWLDLDLMAGVYPGGFAGHKDRAKRFWLSRKVYQDFDLVFFRQKISQVQRQMRCDEQRGPRAYDD